MVKRAAIANVILISLMSFSIFAETKISQSNLSATGQQGLNIDDSKVWNIRPEEWKRYEHIMATEGQYFWRDLDPITVLGLNARNTTERNRFAELLAKQEFNNATKIILLDRAYDKAFKKLYGSIPVIDTSMLAASKTNNTLNSLSKNETLSFSNLGDRYIVFINTKCTQCDAKVIRLMKILTAGVTLDLHFKNDTRAEITKWASKMDISPNDVELGVITLNPNSNLYKKFSDPRQPSAYFFDNDKNKVNPIK